MNRREIKAHLKPLFDDIQFSSGDCLGTQMHRSYLDVTLPTADVERLTAECARVGVRAVGVSVLPYGKDRSHRRLCLGRAVPKEQT